MVEAALRGEDGDVSVEAWARTAGHFNFPPRELTCVHVSLSGPEVSLGGSVERKQHEQQQPKHAREAEKKWSHFPNNMTFYFLFLFMAQEGEGRGEGG